MAAATDLVVSAQTKKQTSEQIVDELGRPPSHLVSMHGVC